MHGRCLYLGSHPGSVHNVRRYLWGCDLPHEPEYWSSLHNCIRRSTSYQLIRNIGAVKFCRSSQGKYVMYLYTHWNWNFVYMYVNRRAGSDLNIMVHKRCSYNSRSVPCLLVWVRGPVEQGRHNAITDSGPDDNTSKRSDGSAGYFLKSRVQRSLEGECVCVQALYLLSDQKKKIIQPTDPRPLQLISIIRATDIWP